MPLAGRNIAVTGADGFIGRYVVEELLARGAHVQRVVAPGTGSADAVEADLLDPVATRRAIQGADLVIHLAAHAGGVEFQQTAALDVLHENNAMTSNVLRACAGGASSRCFIASSGVVYSQTNDGLLSESAVTVLPGQEDITPYAWSKLTAEVSGQWFNGEDLDVVFGRFTNVFGPGAKFAGPGATVVHSLVRKAIEAGPGGTLEVWGDGSAERSFVHVRDCARAVLVILERGLPGEAYNVSSTGAVAICDLAEAVTKVVDPSLTIRYDPAKPTGPTRRVLDDRKLRSLGFEPAEALETGLIEVAEAYRAWRASEPS